MRDSETVQTPGSRHEDMLNMFTRPVGRKIVKQFKYIDEDDARLKVFNSLFKKGPINPGLLNDDYIFKGLENGLNIAEK